MNRDEVLIGRRRNGERMPFEVSDVRTRDEDVLTRNVVEGGLFNTQFEHIGGMGDCLEDNAALLGAQKTDRTFEQIKQQRHNNPDIEVRRLKNLGKTVDAAEKVEGEEQMVCEPEDFEHG